MIYIGCSRTSSPPPTTVHGRDYRPRLRWRLFFTPLLANWVRARVGVCVVCRRVRRHGSRSRFVRFSRPSPLRVSARSVRRDRAVPLPMAGHLVTSEVESSELCPFAIKTIRMEGAGSVGSLRCPKDTSSLSCLTHISLSILGLACKRKMCDCAACSVVATAIEACGRSRSRLEISY